MSACCLPNRVIYALISHLLQCISRGTQPKEKSITHPHTHTHMEEGWLGDTATTFGNS